MLPVDVLKGPDETAIQFSPTQITTHVECARKWAWRRIAKIYTPQNRSAELGSKTHTVLEKYLGEGRRPDFVSDGAAAHIASAVLHLLPAPKTEGISLERPFYVQSTRTGFVYHGLKDVEIAPGVKVPSLELDGDAPGVVDYKTTSNIEEYAKSQDDLFYDAQSALYAVDSMARWETSNADLRWIYSQTKGARKSHVTAVRLPIVHASKVFDAVEREAEEMANALTTGKTPLDLKPNERMCRAYGGCPYKHLCTDLSSSQKARAKVSTSIIATLKSRGQGTPAPETPAPQTEAPVQINPPESQLPPPAAASTVTAPTETATAEEKPTEEKKPRGRPRKAKTDDVAASNGAETAEASGIVVTLPSNVDAKQVVEDIKKDLEATIAATTRAGFTLYVDCLPIGKPAKTLAEYIEKAQQKIFDVGPRDRNGNAVGDYRLIGYGEGVPPFVGYVVEQIDGKTDLTLDTRTPEGAVLLEPLMARAAFVVRGLR